MHVFRQPQRCYCSACGPLRQRHAAGYETLVLKDGQRVTGEVVAEKQNALYVDLGYDLCGFRETRSRREARSTNRPPS